MKRERQTYQVAEVAKLLGIGRNLAYELVRSGKIPSLRLGRRIVVPKGAFDRLLSGDGAGRQTSKTACPVIHAP